MTRRELSELDTAIADLASARSYLAHQRLLRLSAAAHQECEAEDAWHDAECSKDRPVNAEAA